MNDPIQLTDLTWYDPEENTVLITYDRITLALALDEFLDFFDIIDDTRMALLDIDGMCIGTYEEDDKLRKELILAPLEEDLN